MTAAAQIAAQKVVFLKQGVALSVGDAGGSSFESNLDSLIARAVTAEAKKRGAEHASTAITVEDIGGEGGDDGSYDGGG